jgi:carbamoyltransferase
MGRPIAHSVEDALGILFTTGVDAMIIGDYLVEK